MKFSNDIHADLMILHWKEMIKSRKVYIWGAWDLGCLFEEYLMDCIGIPIEGYLDSKPEKENTYWHQKPVKNPSVLQHDHGFVLVAINEYASVRKMLEEYGYMEYQDYIYCGKKTSITKAYNYADLLGNTIVGQIKENCVNMCFHDKLFIGKNVTLGKNTRITLGGFSEIVIEDNVSIGSDVIINALHSSKIIIRSGVKIGSDAFLSSSMESQLIIGSYTSFMMKCTLFADNNTTLEIGKDCMFSHDIKAHSSDGDRHVIIKNGNIVPDNRKDIYISNHVWIGMNVNLLPGTRIGKGSIVGAASLVNKAFPEHVSIAGSPAKVISENVDWQR